MGVEKERVGREKSQFVYSLSIDYNSGPKMKIYPIDQNKIYPIDQKNENISINHNPLQSKPGAIYIDIDILIKINLVVVRQRRRFLDFLGQF